MRYARFTVPAAAALGAAALAFAAGPADVTAYRLRTPGDSVHVRIGSFDRWIRLAGASSRDTSDLPEDDLVLATQGDTLMIPWRSGAAWVTFVRDADTLSSLMRFGNPDGRRLASRRAVLRRYAAFDRGPADRTLDFAPAADPEESAALRRTVPIDSIAGSGGDLARMRRLRHWLHRTVRWDGSRPNPDAASSAELIAACVDSGRTLNCGGMAHAYAAVCAAAGLRARAVVCMPRDRDDPDCHAVTVVYCDSLAHWVFMDPSFDAEWTDDRGGLLDLQTARDRLAAGDTVVVSPDADINGEPYAALPYLAYMGKNLYRFKAWLADGRPVYLEPRGDDASRDGCGPDPATGEPACVITASTSAFWAVPPPGGLR